jgi:hypothetical protein
VSFRSTFLSTLELSTPELSTPELSQLELCTLEAGAPLRESRRAEACARDGARR